MLSLNFYISRLVYSVIPYLDKKISVLLIGRQKKRSMVQVQITAILKLISQVHSSTIFPIPIEIGNLSMPEFWCQRTLVRPPVQTVRKGKGEFCKEGNVALLERANGVVPVKVSFVWLTSRKTYFLALSLSSSFFTARDVWAGETSVCSTSVHTVGSLHCLIYYRPSRPTFYTDRLCSFFTYCRWILEQNWKSLTKNTRWFFALHVRQRYVAKEIVSVIK